jgi:antitoxin (DNA-binding transcriptional repressor) of toxin-antitoxin stability system
MVTVDDLKNAISSNIGTVAAGVGVAAIGAGLVGAAIIGSKRKKKASTKRGRSRDGMFISREKHERRYKRKTKGRRYKTKKSKRTGRRGVKYTKNGQPYIILASGKARFIKGKRRAK